MTRPLAGVQGFDVEGPVQAEVFVVWLDGDAAALTGPCGPKPWYIEAGGDEDPLDAVTQTVRRVIGEPTVAHSTSWRRDRDSVVLSFVVVIEPSLVGEMESTPLQRAGLARGSATSAPAEISTGQVVDHGLRHLAWLVRDDPAVAARLTGNWPAALGGYLPEPFRHLTG